jgi:hypothetical protein
MSFPIKCDNSPPLSPLQLINSSPKRSENAPSTSKPADVSVRTCVPRMIETYQKEPSAMVDKFLLGAMKNSSACKKRRPLLATLKRVQKGLRFLGNR